MSEKEEQPFAEVSDPNRDRPPVIRSSLSSSARMTTLLSAASLCVACYSGYLATQAARQAQRANTIASQANDLSNQNNDIQIKAVREFKEANIIANVANIRQASVEARSLLETKAFKCTGIDFSYLRFTSYEFPAKPLEHCDFHHCDLRWARLSKARLGGSNFEHANLWGAQLPKAELWGSKLSHADLRDANLQGVNLRGAKLESAQLMGTDLRGADLRGAVFTGAQIGYLRVRNLQFKGEFNSDDPKVWRVFRKATDLAGADLRGADFTSCAFEGIHYDDKTKWPKGFEPPPSMGTMEEDS